jgi:hypothetical protein
MATTPTPKQITDASRICGEMCDIFGPPPLLSYENKKAFTDLLYGFVLDLMPLGRFEQMMLWEGTVEVWQIRRGQRHQNAFLERHVRQCKEWEEKALQFARDQMECGENELTRKMARTDYNRLKPSVDRKRDEFDYIAALESTLGWQERLDKLINNAVCRRDNAFRQFEYYRENVGNRLQEVSPKLIEQAPAVADSADTAARPDALAPETVPSVVPQEEPKS